MKGIVFNIFSDLVSEEFGLETWDALIERTNPDSAAIYASTGLYDDSELIAYVAELSSITGAAAPDLVRAFGKYTMHRFKTIHPEFLEDHTARSFLESVHDVIHVEVKKLHTDTILPHFQCVDRGPDQMTMIYRSPRKLCHLAEGLIDGVAEIFAQPIEVHQSVCMHQGADECHLDLTFG